MPKHELLTALSLLALAMVVAGSHMHAAEQSPSLLEGRKHWAYQPLPATSTADIDGMVTKALSAKGLAQSPRAEPDQFLRRVHLVLTGLPPTPAELAAFRVDSSPKAVEKVTDALLARPGFGERWGRHWLDLARYADSSGLHEDSDRPHAWRYRDYVIKSFNEDKPYGRFIREQIAGDVLDPKDQECWTATGFCRTGPTNEVNIGLAEREAYHFEQLDGILKTVSGVFLGQTIACARCHDHKTDPFTARDYYSLLAVFRNSHEAFVPAKGDLMKKPVLIRMRIRAAPRHPRGPGIRALVERPEQEHQETFILDRGDVKSPGEKVRPAIPEVLQGIPAGFQPGQPSPRMALAEWIASPENPLTWRVMANRVWQHLFGQGLVTTPSNLGPSAKPPSHPQLLEHLAVALRDNGGKLKPLIREICLTNTFRQASTWREAPETADPENRLYWRYPPHRLEAEGIRDSILFCSGKLNREAGGRGIKPRIPPEILRQSMRNTWPKVEKEGPEHWRRSVYIYQKRQLPIPMMELLDAPDSSESCARRFSSTTPTQALALLNDAFVNEQAGYAGERAKMEKAEDPVRYLMELIWSRTPSEAQVEKAGEFLKHPEVTLTDLGVVLFNSSPFVYVD